jgi:phosphoenolpyruvate synthase/pyruvate phosphate dikinase
MNQQQLKKIIFKDWYIQGFNAYPLFLNPAAYSGFTMKKYIGLSYSGFLLNYSKGYGEMAYLNIDFDKLWLKIRKKISSDKNYLNNLRKKYQTNFLEKFGRFNELDQKKVSALTNDELIAYLKLIVATQVDTVGPAHIIESVSLNLEKDLKRILYKTIKNKKLFNQYFSLLTAPNKLSFIAQAEKELIKIGSQGSLKQKSALLKYQKKYFWLENSYVGSKNLTIQDFRKYLNILLKKGAKYPIILSKRALISKLSLSRRVVELIKNIELVAAWQDERKSNIIKNIHYSDLIAKEISRRFKIKLEAVYYLGIKDIEKLKKFADLEKLRSELIKRIKGAFFIMWQGNEQCLTGKRYQVSVKILKDHISHEMNIIDLHGQVANPGTAIGRAVICRGIDSLVKVKNGDVIVASMTRPEFIPALKKASAIVTDEGSITSHAAIISRELKIPCIIGTKIATKIIHDGDLVEVRANHGIVKIIK